MKFDQNCPTGCEMSGCGAHKHLVSGECLSQAISKSMTALEASSFPSVFKEGWLRLNKKVPFLSGADGVVSKFKQNKEAARPFTNHHDCADNDASRHLLIAQPPLLENGGEWTRLATNPSPPLRVATCRTVLINNQFSIF